MIVLVGVLIWMVSSRYGVLWALPLMAVQGYLVAFLFMAVHETAHKTAFRSRGLNLAVGYLSAFIIGLAIRILLPVPLGPSSLHPGSGQGPGADRRREADIRYATRDRL